MSKEPETINTLPPDRLTEKRPKVGDVFAVYGVFSSLPRRDIVARVTKAGFVAFEGDKNTLFRPDRSGGTYHGPGTGFRRPHAEPWTDAHEREYEARQVLLDWREATSRAMAMGTVGTKAKITRADVEALKQLVASIEARNG